MEKRKQNQGIQQSLKQGYEIMKCIRCFKREIEKTKVVQVIHLFFFKKTKL